MIEAISLIPPPPNWHELFNRICQEEDFWYKFKFVADLDSDSFKNADAIIAAIFQTGHLQKAKKLKFLQVPFSGLDKIDLEHLNKNGIAVANSHENSVSVAEHGMLFLLALSKNLINQDSDLRQGIWHGWVARETNNELNGKTLGIIGLGNIGYEMARKAKCFGMRVVGIKKDPNIGRKKLSSVVDFVYPPGDLNFLIKQSDFLFISVPLTKETKGMIGRTELQLMKGKYLINVSRGNIIKQRELFTALKNNILKGAAIDTWYNYPSVGKVAAPSRYPFHELGNIIMTPHTAGYTAECLQRNWIFSFRNIARFFNGGRIQNAVKFCPNNRLKD
jgi:phosphoglycerate dehydrogenase-like enzyme